MKNLSLLFAMIVSMVILCSGIASAAPGDSCGAGRVLDCSGKCVSASTANSWSTDSYCDDGAYGMDLVCGAFNYDGGACDADGGQCSTATPVELNTITDGIIDSDGDHDYFRVDVPESGTLTVYTTGNSDTYGYLKNSGCSQLVTNDDSGPAYNFQISRAVSRGTYYVGVRHYSASRTGEYDLNVEFTPDDDHGDNCSTGTPVNVATTTGGIIGTSRDYDYFRVDLPASGTLNVYTNGNSDTYGYLKNSACTQIGNNDDSGAGYNFRISQDVSAGSYYVGVRHYSSNRTGAYTLNVEFTPGIGTREIALILSQLNQIRSLINQVPSEEIQDQLNILIMLIQDQFEKIMDQMPAQTIQDQLDLIMDQIQDQINILRRMSDIQDQVPASIQDQIDMIMDQIQDQFDGIMDQLRGQLDYVINPGINTGNGMGSPGTATGSDMGLSFIMDQIDMIMDQIQDQLEIQDQLSDIQDQLPVYIQDQLDQIMDQIQDQFESIMDQIQDQLDHVINPGINTGSDMGSSFIMDQIQDQLDQIMDQIQDQLPVQTIQDQLDLIMDQMGQLNGFTANPVATAITNDQIQDQIQDQVQDQIQDQIQDQFDPELGFDYGVDIMP